MKLEHLLEVQTEREKIRREKHIGLWLLFLTPVGIFKSFKYKAFSLHVNILFSITWLFLILTFFVQTMNPYEIKNVKAENQLITYKDYGDLLEYRLIDDIDLNGINYRVYDCTTNQGIFNVFLNKDENYKVDYVYGRYSRKVLLDNELIEDFDNNLYNEIFLYFQNEEIQTKYGVITGLLTEDPEITLEDNGVEYEGIVTTKGKYVIGCLYNQVIQIYDVNKENELIYQRRPQLTLPNSTLAKINNSTLRKEIGNIDIVFAFIWSNNASYYYFTNTNGTIFNIKHTYDDKYVLNWGDKTEDNEKEYEVLMEYVSQFEDIG